MQYTRLGKVLKKLDENKTLALGLYNLTNEMDFRKGYIAFAEAMERLVNKIRTAVIKEADIDKSYYMSRVVKVLDISVKKIDNGKISITLPYLMPKRTSIDSDAYIIDPLSYALRMYVEQNKHEKFRNASVAIIFIHTPEDRRIIRDLDNIETHHVINIISTMLLVDDNLIDMGLFNRPGDYVHTEIIVSSRDKKNEEDEKKGKNA